MKSDGHFTIETDNARLKTVMTKLIAGHLRFEGLDQLFLHNGFEIHFYQDTLANREFYSEFHSPIYSGLLSEYSFSGMLSSPLLRYSFNKKAQK